MHRKGCWFESSQVHLEKMMSRQHSAGKGDSYRRVDSKKYRENYEKIFGKKKKTVTKKKDKKS